MFGDQNLNLTPTCLLIPHCFVCLHLNFRYYFGQLSTTFYCTVTGRVLKHYLTAEVFCPLRRRLIMEGTFCTDYLLLCSNVSNEHTNLIHWWTVCEPGILSSLCFYFLLFFSPFSSSFLILWFVCLLWYVWPWNESLTFFFYSKPLIN